MDPLELAERLREKTGCSYAEAKAALDSSGGDLLDALCWLEQHGKTQLVHASCSTEQQPPPQAEPETKKKTRQPPENNGFIRGCQSLWAGLVELIRRCNQTQLVMTSRSGQREFALPLTLFIILLLAAFWVVIALLVIAMFFGNRFTVEGTLGHRDVNDILSKATDFAEDIKNDVLLRNDEEQNHE